MFNFIDINSTATELKHAERQAVTHDLAYCLSLVYAHECCGYLTILWLGGKNISFVSRTCLSTIRMFGYHGTGY
jgi:hypothetical protein